MYVIAAQVLSGHAQCAKSSKGSDSCCSLCAALAAEQLQRVCMSHDYIARLAAEQLQRVRMNHDYIARLATNCFAACSCSQQAEVHCLMHHCRPNALYQ